MSGIFSVRLPYKIRCQLPECGKPVHLAFKMEMDGMMNTFCSPDHANVGLGRWEEKKRLNLKPGEIPLIQKDELVGDNLQELDEE